VLALPLARQQHETTAPGLQPTKRRSPNLNRLWIEVLWLYWTQPFGGIATQCPAVGVSGVKGEQVYYSTGPHRLRRVAASGVKGLSTRTGIRYAAPPSGSGS